MNNQQYARSAMRIKDLIAITTKADWTIFIHKSLCQSFTPMFGSGTRGFAGLGGASVSS
jgi:hypothetical protein